MGRVSGGALAAGLGSVAGLAVATRSLGAGPVAPLAVAWTLAVVVGPGLWSGVEQEVARATARGERTDEVARLVARRALMAAPIVAAAGLAGRHLVFAGSTAVPVALAVVAAAYGPLHLAWGRLAGEGRSGAQAASMAVEGGARLVLVGGTSVLTHHVGASAGALAAAVTLAALWAMLASRGSAARVTGLVDIPGPELPNGGRGAVADRIRWLTGAGLLSQALFLTSPATFTLLAPSGDPRTARLAMAVLLARAPALAWKGVLAAVVPAVAADRDGAARAVRGVARAAVIGAVVAGAVGAAAAAAFGDRVLDLLTGGGPGLGVRPLALLAAATAAYLGALTVTAALAGAGQARAAAAAWLVGSVMSVAALAVPGDPVRRVVSALAVGTVVALAGLVRAGIRRDPGPRGGVPLGAA